MKFYRVDISNGQIVECKEITKRNNLHDYLLIKKYKGFVHINPVGLQPTAYLCKASGYFEAKEKAFGFLERTAKHNLQY